MSPLTPELPNRLRQKLHGWLREDLEFHQLILNIASSVDYERKHQIKADRRLAIIPFLDLRASVLPEKTGH